MPFLTAKARVLRFYNCTEKPDKLVGKTFEIEDTCYVIESFNDALVEGVGISGTNEGGYTGVSWSKLAKMLNLPLN